MNRWVNELVSLALYLFMSNYSMDRWVDELVNLAFDLRSDCSGFSGCVNGQVG